MTTEPVIEKKTSWTAEFASRMGVLGELFGFLWKVKMWWMIPMIVMLFLFAVIFIFGASSPLAPFIYSLR
jgi:hypothetical protein